MTLFDAAIRTFVGRHYPDLDVSVDRCFASHRLVVGISLDGRRFAQAVDEPPPDSLAWRTVIDDVVRTIVFAVRELPIRWAHMAELEAARDGSMLA